MQVALATLRSTAKACEHSYTPPPSASFMSSSPSLHSLQQGVRAKMQFLLGGAVKVSILQRRARGLSLSPIAPGDGERGLTHAGHGHQF